MLEYLRKRQGEAKAQETEKEQAAVPAGAGNQAMLSMLKAQGERGEVQPASGGTPLAEAMRAKFERHFGLPMDDVRVHRNSDEPAKFDAGAYTYGTDIFIGPGQEDLLNHEMTHVAQQKLGQVRPTGMEHGMAVNRSPALEYNADLGVTPQMVGSTTAPVVQCDDYCNPYDDPIIAQLKSIISAPIDTSSPIDAPRLNRRRLKITNCTDADSCHGYTLSLLMKMEKHPKKFPYGLNNLGQTIIDEVKKFLLIHPRIPPAGVAPEMPYDISVIFDSAIRAGLVEEITDKSRFSDSSMKNKIGQILLMYQSQGQKTSHSMVISGVDEVTGANNISSLGSVGSKELGNFGSHKIQTFKDFSKRLYSRIGEEDSMGGWERDSTGKKDIIKSLLTGGEMDVAILPVVGELPAEYEQRIKRFKEIMDSLYNDDLRFTTIVEQYPSREDEENRR